MGEHGWNWSTIKSGECYRDALVGREVKQRAARASWWEWNDGSTLSFWRWPKPFRKEARDGVPVRCRDERPQFRGCQAKEKDEFVDSKVTSKLRKINERGYIEVKSLTKYFVVPKGTGDIRMVDDASSSGLNDCVYAPNFALPTVDSLLTAVGNGTYLADIDLGEMFLNFPLDPKIRPYAGIDVYPYLIDGQESRGVFRWRRWNRNLMGFKPSPYNSVHSMVYAEDVIRGNPCDVSNPFHFDFVRLNLPGQDSYDPTLPWVSKCLSLEDGIVLASDFCVYVDDLHPTGSSEWRCWEATKRITQLVQYLGIQDTAQKRRGLTQHPGAWAGLSGA